MSRQVGQIHAGHAAGVLAGLLGALSAIVLGMGALLVPGKPLPPLPAPAEDSAAPAGGAACPPADAPLPGRVTSAQLFECPHSYDGRRISFTGEAVGAVLRRGDRAWLQLNDDVYGLQSGPLPEHRTGQGGNSGVAVLADAAVVDAGLRVGGYRWQGTLLAVTGIFRAADPVDGGGPVLRAEQVAVQRPGRRLRHVAWPARQWAAGGLALVTVGLAALTLAARRRRLG